MKSFKTFINEEEYIEKIKDTELLTRINEIVKGDYETCFNTYIRFSRIKDFNTDVNKDDVRQAKKFYSTPCGLYAYPLLMIRHNKNNIPFSSSSDYIHLFETTDDDNIISINSYCGNQFEHLDNFFDSGQETFCGIDCDELKDEYDSLMEETDYSNEGSNLYYVTQKLAMYIDDELFPVYWKKILNKICKVSGIYDMGNKVINKNEPWQAVFFDTKCIKSHTTYENK